MYALIFERIHINKTMFFETSFKSRQVAHPGAGVLQGRGRGCQSGCGDVAAGSPGPGTVLLMLMMWHQQWGVGEGRRAETAPTRPHSDQERACQSHTHINTERSTVCVPVWNYFATTSCWMFFLRPAELDPEGNPRTADVFVFSCCGDVELKADSKVSWLQDQFRGNLLLHLYLAAGKFSLESWWIVTNFI